MFDLVRELNTAIDAGELGADGCGGRFATRSNSSTACSACSHCARPKTSEPPVPVEEIERLIAARREARLARNFAEADRIRKDLESRGVILEDSGATTRWKRK